MKSFYQNFERALTGVNLPVDYVLTDPNPKKLLILLHGYVQSGDNFYFLLKHYLPKDRAVLTINGIFPVPELVDNKYKLGFSWYFYDGEKDEYLIEPSVAASAIKQLLDQLHLQSVPKTIIGHSQGAYLAPFVADLSQNVTQVIGIAGQYLIDEIKTPTYRADAVHGEKDRTVKPEGAMKAHSELLGKGAQGKFVLVPEQGHRLSPLILDEVKKLII